MLYNIIFFRIEIPNIPIQKIAISITIQGLGANKHITNQYTFTDINILAKNIQRQKVTTHIQHKIYLVEELKANILIDLDIIMLKQFDLDFSKKTAFIGSYSCSFDLDIKILCVSI